MWWCDAHVLLSSTAPPQAAVKAVFSPRWRGLRRLADIGLRAAHQPNQGIAGDSADPAYAWTATMVLGGAASSVSTIILRRLLNVLRRTQPGRSAGQNSGEYGIRCIVYKEQR